MIKSKFYDVSIYNKENLYELDSVRGLMCIFILGCHFFALLSYHLPIWKGVISPFKILENAQLGLCYFFLLSGFVISWSYQKKRTQIVVWRYTVNRFLRLFPPVFFSIVMMWLFYYKGWLTITDNMIEESKWLREMYMSTPHKNSYNPFFDVFFNSFLGGEVIYNGNLWAIRYEFLVPICMVIIIPYMHYRLVRLILCFVVLIMLTILGGKRYFYFGNMLLSMQMCYYFSSFNYKRWRKTVNILLILSVCTSNLFVLPLHNTIIKWINLITALSILVYVIFDESSFKHTIMNNIILRKMGKLSYEIYVFHLFFLLTLTPFVYNNVEKVMERSNSILIAYFLTILITIVFSAIFNKYISTPFNKIRV